MCNSIQRNLNGVGGASPLLGWGGVGEMSAYSVRNDFPRLHFPAYTLPRVDELVCLLYLCCWELGATSGGS
jgi:hypothetical protein